MTHEGLRGSFPPVRFKKEGVKFIGEKGFAEKISLHVRTFESIEESHLLAGFNPFGNDVQPEAACHGDYCNHFEYPPSVE